MSKECHDTKTPAPKTTEFSDLQTKVDNAAFNLEHHQKNSGQPATMHAILDEVYGSALKGKSAAYQAAFVDFLDRKLEVDEKKTAVVDAFADENFAFLANGKKRIQASDLDGKAAEFGLLDRTIEKRLTEDLADSQTNIEKAHHEGVFLGLGHKHGIDRKRLSSYDQKDYDKTESEQVLKRVANPDDWDRLTGGTQFRPGTEAMTQPQLDQTIVNNYNPYASTPRMGPAQEDALAYVGDHFHKMSKNVTDYYGGTERIATVDSMSRYAAKHGVNWATIMANRAAKNQYNYDVRTVNPSDYQD